MNAVETANKEVEEAEQVLRDMQAAEAAATAGTPPAPPAVETPAPATPAAAETGTETPAAVTPPEEPAAPVPAAAEPTPAPVAVPPPAPEETAAHWEQKFKVINGKYLAEVPRLAKDNSDLRNLNQRLQTQLASAEARAAAAEERATTKNVLDSLDPALVDQLGPAAAEAMAKQMAKQSLDLKNEMAQSSQNSVQEVRKASFVQTLNLAVPDWAEINADNDFRMMLRDQNLQPDIDAATAALDPAPIVSILRQFKAAKAKTVTAPTVAPKPPPPAVQPRKGAGGADPTATPNVKIYTVEEYGKLMDKVTFGKLPEAAARKLEAELDNAYREGRVK